MGIGKHLFIEPVPLDLLCNICSEVLSQPVQVHCGEDHIFCHECIIAIVEKQQAHDTPCPTCNMPMNTNTLQPSKFVQRQLGRLSIKCQYHSSGCTWIGTLASDHINHCTFKSRECSNAKQGCTLQCDEETMAQHELVCEYGVMECPNGFCSSSYLKKDAGQHESNCRSYPCLYATSGCQYIGTVPEVTRHCAIYCGRLHDRIQQLEQECFILGQQLGLHLDHNNNGQSPTLVNTLLSPPPQLQQGNDDTTQADPLLQMVNDHDIFKLMQDNLTSPPPPIKATSPPKRTPKGKRIRYSKNTKLAHGALRASKSATTTTTTLDEDQTIRSPCTATLDDVSSPASVGTPGCEDLSRLMDTLSTNSQHSPVAFNTLDDVAKFFDTLPPSRPTAPKKKTGTSPLPTQKPNPMFVLASSYLSNCK
ncbi:hypothetical protein BC941DRAFT_409845 [Chlamydoabsidia padenii]|nr:hypothetical protein BC941DRAFT_409845 [Chlamydoabsidia padenii]